MVWLLPIGPAVRVFTNGFVVFVHSELVTCSALVVVAHHFESSTVFVVDCVFLRLGFGLDSVVLIILLFGIVLQGLLLVRRLLSASSNHILYYLIFPATLCAPSTLDVAIVSLVPLAALFTFPVIFAVLLGSMLVLFLDLICLLPFFNPFLIITLSHILHLWKIV